MGSDSPDFGPAGDVCRERGVVDSRHKVVKGESDARACPPVRAAVVQLAFRRRWLPAFRAIQVALRTAGRQRAQAKRRGARCGTKGWEEATLLIGHHRNILFVPL